MPPLFHDRTIIDLQVKDVVETSEQKILAAGVQSAMPFGSTQRFSSSTARSAAN